MLSVKLVTTVRIVSQTQLMLSLWFLISIQYRSSVQSCVQVIASIMQPLLWNPFICNHCNRIHLSSRCNVIHFCKCCKGIRLQQNFSISNFGISNFRFYRTMLNGPATINANKSIWLISNFGYIEPLRFDIIKFCCMHPL